MIGSVGLSSPFLLYGASVMTYQHSRRVLRHTISAASLSLIVFAIAAQAVEAEETPYRLFTIDVDGSNLTRLHQRDDWSAGSPQWSTDGKQIAYDSWPDTETYRTSEVVIARANGNNPRYLGRGAMPSWSKDDTKIVYHQYRDGSGVAVMNTDGTDSRRIASGCGSPRWGPNGEAIAYVDWGTTLVVHDPILEVSRNVLESGWSPYWGLNWSPDGRWLCFRSQRNRGNDGESELCIVSTDGSDNTPRVLVRGSVSTHCAWSPDGKRIVICLNDKETGRSQLHLVNVYLIESSEPVMPVLLEGQDPDRVNVSPDWSPDGSKIVFVSIIPPAPNDEESVPDDL